MTFEQLEIALQAHRNLENLRNDLRSNALFYQSQLAAGRPRADVAAVMAADAREYARRLKWHTDFAADNKRNKTLTDGLAALGLTRGEHDSIVAELSAATQIQSVGTNPDATATAVLAAVSAHDKVFGFVDTPPGRPPA